MAAVTAVVGVVVVAIVVIAFLVLAGVVLLPGGKDLPRSDAWGFRFIWLCLFIAGLWLFVGPAVGIVK